MGHGNGEFTEPSFPVQMSTLQYMEIGKAKKSEAMDG